jgi:photosystem II PsbU protein
MVMCRIALVAACLVYVGEGRRVQTANDALAHSQEAEYTADADVTSSLLEVRGMAGLNPTMNVPHHIHAGPVASIKESPHLQPAPHASAPHASMSAVAADMAQTQVPLKADAASKAPLKADAKAADKVPWYANMRNNALFLVAAMVCARVALSVRSMIQARKADGGSAGVARAPVVVMKDTSAPSRWQLPSRRDIITRVFGASALGGAASADAVVDYAGVGYLGGAKTIDVNNANVRVYQKLPGMYPIVAGKIVAKAPYKDKADMYAKAGFEATEAEVAKKFDKDFIFLEPQAEFVIDNINNGLYR